jgi:hypothetical protein
MTELEVDPISTDKQEQLLSVYIPTSPPRSIDDANFLEIRNVLNRNTSTIQWSKRPRLFTVLRLLDCSVDSDVARGFIEDDLYDVCLPLASQYAPSTLASNEELLERFLYLQDRVLSRPDSMNASNFLRGAHEHGHRHVSDGPVYFEPLESLGEGGSGSVGRVRHKLSGETFACKKIYRGKDLEEQRQMLVKFRKELSALQRVQHKHLVRCLGSFTDRNFFSLVSPDYSSSLIDPTRLNWLL